MTADKYRPLIVFTVAETAARREADHLRIIPVRDRSRKSSGQWREDQRQTAATMDSERRHIVDNFGDFTGNCRDSRPHTLNVPVGHFL